MKKISQFRPVLAAVLVAFSSAVAWAQPYTFGTLAGSASNPGGNDGTNSTAQFTAPTGLALDTASNLFLADGNAIRRVAPSGTNWVVRTLAGAIGTHSFIDGTNGVAQFNAPQGVAADSGGNLYVADTLNNAIRKITPSGTNWVVRTIAGPLPPSTAVGTADGSNNVARFNQPFGIAVDSNTNLYVADTSNHTIRKAALIGTNWVVTTLAGLAGTSGTSNGSNSIARFNNPTGITVDSSGNLYVADFANNSIRRITQIGTNWAVTTLAGTNGPSGTNDGLGSAARFNLPQCLAVDSAQNLFVTDSGNSTIRKITPAGLVSTLAGSPGITAPADGTGSAAHFNQPYGIAVDGSGALFVVDYLGYAVREGRLAPVLRYSVSGKQLILSWPIGLTGFAAQVSTTLSNSSWNGVTNIPTAANEYWFVTNAIPTGAGFYRLHK